MGELHVGEIVHHVLIFPADDENDAKAVCEAALVTKIGSREKRVVSLHIFPECSKTVDATNVVHSINLEHSTWHFISGCPTHS
jgi:hypothetical protein